MAEHIDTRITVMETVFNSFQKSLVEHMKHEEKAFDRLHADIKMVIERLDDTGDNIRLSAEKVKRDMGESIDEGYVSKLEFEQSKTFVSSQIKESQRETFSRLTWIGSAIMSVITFAGWFYIESHKLGVQ